MFEVRPAMHPVDSLVEMGRRHARRCLIGLGLGFALGLVVTAVRVATSPYGYLILPDQLLFNLIWATTLGLIVGHNLGRPHPPGLWRWRRPQIRTGTLMGIIACLAVLLGMGITAVKLGDSARSSYLRFATNDSLWPPLIGQTKKAKVEARFRHKNVEELRSGKIPEGLHKLQREFLSGLESDPKVTTAYRQERRDLIQAGEEWQASIAERNVVVLPQAIQYYQRLAAKYDEARWHPWRPVEPDPPAPAW